MIRRRFIGLLLALATVVPVAGCGSSSSTTVTTVVGAQATTAAQATTTTPTVSSTTPTTKSTPTTKTTTGSAEATTTPTASTGVWNSAQCNTALSAYYSAHPGASTKSARGYKISLSSQHRCFTPKSHAPVPTQTASTWNTVQCNTALIAWYKGNKGADKQATKAYKISLSKQHGCGTARSLNP